MSFDEQLTGYIQWLRDLRDIARTYDLQPDEFNAERLGHLFQFDELTPDEAINDEYEPLPMTAAEREQQKRDIAAKAAQHETAFQEWKKAKGKA